MTIAVNWDVKPLKTPKIMAHSLLFSNHIICVISINTVASKAAWKTVQILIRRLPQKLSDLDLHCFLKLMMYLGPMGKVVSKLVKC